VLFRSCWQDAAKDPASNISAEAEVRVDGPRVGLARGLSRFALESAAASAVGFAGLAPAPTPPLGAPKPAAATQKPRAEQGSASD